MKTFLIVVSIVLSLCILFGFLFCPTTTLWCLTSFIGVLVVGSILMLFGLRGIDVEESTAVSFKFLGQFCCCIMEFTGYHFDSGGNIVPGEGSNCYKKCWAPIFSIGGWVFYFRPFVRPVRYDEKNEPDGFGQDVYYVNLNDVTFQTQNIMAETTEATDGSKKKKRVPLNVEYTTTGRVRNPYLWQFRSARNVGTQVVENLVAGLREWVGLGGEDHAQQTKKQESLWDELINNTPNGQTIIRKIAGWGLIIGPGDILVKSIGYTPEMQAALQAKSVAELNAEGRDAEIYGPIRLATGKETIGEAEAIELRKMAMAGGNATYEKSYKTWDIQSGGQPVNPDMAGLLVAAEAIGSAFAGNRGRGNRDRNSGGQGASHGGTSPAGASAPKMSDQEIAEATKQQSGLYPSWWDPINKRRK